MKSTFPLTLATVVSTRFISNASLHASDTDDRIESSAAKSYTFKTCFKDDSIKVESKDGIVTLTDADLSWLHATFGTNQLTVFPTGGHLGNLGNTNVQKAILAALTPTRPPDPKPE